ncbi:MAG: hypothetical protein P3X22_007345 [Thermoprotei archaeon]|nr:hypothetical protein [Thermoprotei archaeon]
MNSENLKVEENIVEKIQSISRLFLNKDYTPPDYRETLTEVMRKLNPKPAPLGGKCSNKCPYLKCSKDFIQVNKRVTRGIQAREVICLLLGGPCKGSECRYFTCTLKALNSDGNCLLALLLKRGL